MKCTVLRSTLSTSGEIIEFNIRTEKLIEIFFRFRFDDIFLGIVALKAKIQPLHSEEFYFYKATYKGPASYRYVLASHGYDNPDEMLKIWSEVRANGYA